MNFFNYFSSPYNGQTGNLNRWMRKKKRKCFLNLEANFNLTNKRMTFNSIFSHALKARVRAVSSFAVSLAPFVTHKQIHFRPRMERDSSSLIKTCILSRDKVSNFEQRESGRASHKNFRTTFYFLKLIL